jgi:hypothetical protein
MLWLRGRRPKQPRNWRALVRAAERRVAKWARGGLKKQDGEEIFEDLWSTHKVAFSRKQRGKCAYCEMPIAADPSGGDIEHYRPKAAVTKLLDDPTTWGEEVVGHNSRDPSKRRRAPLAFEGKGYHFLAYAWSNYLLSCGTCNQKWKGNLFPVEGGHVRRPTRKSLPAERALLLNPYEDEDPVNHLAFDRIGQVTPHLDSLIGWETIRTCHLGRESLRSQRKLFAAPAWGCVSRVLRELLVTPRDERRLRRAIIPLLNLGASRRPHAGMVRILWSHRNPFGLSWADLRALRAELNR